MKTALGSALRRLISMNRKEWTRDEFEKKVIPKFPKKENKALARLLKQGFTYLKYWKLGKRADGVTVVQLNENLYQAGQRLRSQTPMVQQTPAP